MQDNLKVLLEKFKLPIALSFLGIVLIIGGIFSSGLDKQKKDFPKESLVEGIKIISVDVSGAVQSPGVYKLKEGSRIEDAIKSAGGFSEDANSQYISKSLNMAQKLSDGSKVYVPTADENHSSSSGSAGSVAGINIQAKVNINSSSQQELESLPGVGPVTASKVVSGRPYQTIEELLSKKAVGKAVFEKIKDLVVVY